MASKIKVDQIAESTTSAGIELQNNVTIPTGKTLTVTDGIGIGSLPTITVAKGGTGLAGGFSAGDVLYATGATTLAKLAKGTAEQVLAMNAGATAPDWGSVDLTVLPTITVAKGGTNIASFTAGDILYATGSTTLAKLAKGTGSQTLKMNAGATAPEWATVAAPSSDMVKLLSTSITNANPASVDGYFTADYDMYLVRLMGHAGTSSAVDVRFAFRQGDADVTSSNYSMQMVRGYNNSTVDNAGYGESAAPSRTWYTQSKASYPHLNTTVLMWIFEPLNTTRWKNMHYTVTSMGSTSGQNYLFTGNFILHDTGALSGFSFRNGATDIEDLTMYGFKN